MVNKHRIITAFFLICSLLFFLAGISETLKRYKTIEVPQTTSNVGYNRLRIAKLNVDLPIFPGAVTDGLLSTIDYGVQTLEHPKTGTNLIIYGHNWPNLFGTLNKLQKGDAIVIISDVGVQRLFLVEGSYEVTPNQTHVTKQTQDKRITLITCSGFMDSKRLIVVGKLVTTTTAATTLDSQVEGL